MFGNRLKSLRESKGIVQKELAKELGLTIGAISNFERSSRNPDNEMLVKISNYFNVSTDYLLGRTDDPTSIIDINQDLYDEHNYSKELDDFLKDNEIISAFEDYGSWTEEEKRNVLNFVKGQKALKKLNQK